MLNLNKTEGRKDYYCSLGVKDCRLNKYNAVCCRDCEFDYICNESCYCLNTKEKCRCYTHKEEDEMGEYNANTLLAKKLSEAISERGMTTKICNATGIKETSLRNYSLNITPAPFIKALKIIKYLNLDIHEFMNIAEDEDDKESK